MTNAQQVWVISIVSAMVGGLSGAIASFYFAKSLNKTSLAMEFFLNPSLTVATFPAFHELSLGVAFP